MNDIRIGDIRHVLGEHDFFAAMDPRHLDTLAEMSRWSDHAASSWLASPGPRRSPDAYSSWKSMRRNGFRSWKRSRARSGGD